MESVPVEAVEAPGLLLQPVTTDPMATTAERDRAAAMRFLVIMRILSSLKGCV